MHLAFDSIALLRFQRKLAEIGNEELIAATDRIARSFREYKLPIIPITTNDVDLATRTFQRINSQGATMSETHMVHALAWRPGFDLQKKIADLRKIVLLDREWDEISDDPILKACKAAFGLDVYKASADDLSGALVRHPTTVDTVLAAIGRTADFLWHDCGIRTPDMVPYALQIVALAEAFRFEPEPSQPTRRILAAWLWITTYSEFFAGMSGDRMQVALADMRQTVDGGRGKWTWKRQFEVRGLRPTFDFRAARSKAFAYHLARIQDRELGHRKGSSCLAEHGRRGIVQLLPWNLAKKGSAYSHPGNRFLLAPTEVSEFRERLLRADLTDEELRSHMISYPALRTLQHGDFVGFVKHRAYEIERSEEDFLRDQLQCFGLKIELSTLARPEDVLRANNEIEIVSGEDLSFQFRLRGLDTVISLKITELGERAFYKTSHAIKTPFYSEPFRPTRVTSDTVVEATRAALMSLVPFYQEAIARGLEPNDSWLVSNSD